MTEPQNEEEEPTPIVARPKYPHALLLSRQVIRRVIEQLNFPEALEIKICRDLINGIEEVIEKI